MSIEWTARGHGQRPAFGCRLRSERSSISTSAMSLRAVSGPRGVGQPPVVGSQLGELERVHAAARDQGEQPIAAEHERGGGEADQHGGDALGRHQ